jgi:hypothetical protein
MPPNVFVSTVVFVLGLALVSGVIYSALSTFVLPRSSRSFLNHLVFGGLRRVFALLLRFVKTYARADALLAYYAPVGLMLLLPAWYILTAVGYAGMYWALGAGNALTCFRLSGSSLLTLGFATADDFWVNNLVFSEATLGLVLVALLIAYLPTMYSAFSRREGAVNLLEVRAGSPPSAVMMIERFHRIHGLERLNDYWPVWEAWFADVEESHSVLPALVFFRSPRPQNSWVVAAGAVLDAAALSTAALDVPVSAAAQLSIRAGFLALRRICDNFGIATPADPHFPADPIHVARDEFEAALERLAAAGIPLKPDREQAWADFAGWRVNYDAALLALCDLTMAPAAPWSSDRAARGKVRPWEGAGWGD